MKISFIKKIKLSFSLGGLFIMLMTAALPLVYLLWLFLDTSGSPEMTTFYNAVSMAMYGLCLSSYMIMSYSITVSGMKFMKTLPLTNTDISDIAAIELVTTAVSAALGQTLLSTVTGNYYLIPWFLCIDAALMAAAFVFAPSYMQANYTKTSHADEAEYKRKTLKSAILALLYIISGAAISCLIIFQAVKNDFSSAGIWLAVISAVSLIIFVFSTIVCHRMNINVEC